MDLEQNKRVLSSSFNGTTLLPAILTTDSLVNKTTQAIKGTANTISSLTDTVQSIKSLELNISDAFTNSQQYQNVADNFVNVSKVYFDNKIKRIQNLWDTKVDVSVEALLGEVAPYTMSFSDASRTLSKKISNVISYIAGTNEGDGWRGMLSGLGEDVISTLSADSSLVSSISSLSVVKATADSISSVISFIDVIKGIKEVIEAVRPMLSFTTNMALTFWSGGTSAVEASNIITSEANKLSSKVRTLVLFALKKFIFPLKIKVPALIVGAVDSISVRSVMLDPSVSENPYYAEYSMLFNNEFFDDLEFTSQWSNSISDAINAVKKATQDTQGLISNSRTQDIFKSTLTNRYLSNVSKEASRIAGTDISKFGDKSKVISGSENSEDDVKSNLDKVIESYTEMTPITSVESLISISKTLYEAIQ